MLLHGLGLFHLGTGRRCCGLPGGSALKMLDDDVRQNKYQAMNEQRKTISHDGFPRARKDSLTTQVTSAAAPAKPADEPVMTAQVRVAPKFSDLVTLTREELYQHVWKTPIHLLSEAVGLSDVGLAKICKQMNVPRPGRGYWARLDAGEHVKMVPLGPPLAAGMRQWTFDIVANRQRRADWAGANLSAPINAKSQSKVELPGEHEPLHDIAAQHREALEKLKPDDNGFVHLNSAALFRCDVSVAMVPKLARVIHALITHLEKNDCRVSHGNKECPHLSLTQGSDRLTVNWSEEIEEFEREPTIEEKRRPSWTWQLKQRRATGRITIEISAMALRGTRSWTESKNRPPEQVLARVLEKIAAAFEGFDAQRQREAERERQRAEFEKQRAETEAKREREWREQQRSSEHQKQLNEIARVRRFNLGVAAQQWEDSERVLAFVDAVERHWHGVPAVELSPDQLGWLAWARSEAKKLALWSDNYPDPNAVRILDPDKIPVGGPYPRVTTLKPHEFRHPGPEHQSPNSGFYGSRY